jgi:hypothetical protein
MSKLLYSYITEVLGFALMVFIFAVFTLALFDAV